MSQRIEGRITRTGVQVLESYSLELDLTDEQLSAYREDPIPVLRQFLEQEGHTVNRVSLLIGEGTAMAMQEVQDSTTTQRMNSYHIVYPDNEKSGWICA